MLFRNEKNKVPRTFSTDDDDDNDIDRYYQNEKKTCK